MLMGGEVMADALVSGTLGCDAGDDVGFIAGAGAGARVGAGVGVGAGEEHATNKKATTSITLARIYCTFLIYISSCFV